MRIEGQKSGDVGGQKGGGRQGEVEEEEKMHFRFVFFLFLVLE